MYSYPVKCEPHKNIQFKGLIIIISNDWEVEDEALKRRILYVSAQVPYYQTRGTILHHVKEEPESEVEETCISDSEECSSTFAPRLPPPYVEGQEEGEDTVD